MALLTVPDAYHSIRVSQEEDTCFLQIHRPQAQNTITSELITEMTRALARCEPITKILVLTGLPDVFCAGADFSAIERDCSRGVTREQHDPTPLYDLWARLATGPFISVAHVRGRTNAGGIGFVAACDVVLSDHRASFSLSEMLFGLMPACVLPFLVRRVGFARANYMTLMTQPVTAGQALEWGLSDALDENSEALLRRHLLRLRRLSQPAIGRYKSYMKGMNETLSAARAAAVRANIEMFSDASTLENIVRYVQSGRFPWEASA